jgi:hypothetical protein
VSSGPRENTALVASRVIFEKWGLTIEPHERYQMLACHRVTKGIVMAFNSTLPGSLYEKLLYRPDNWHGQLSGNPLMEVFLYKHCGRHDGPIKSGLLQIR